MAVKIGDLNGSAQTSSLIDLDDRNNLDLFSIQAEDQSFESGEIIEVDITADKIREVLGYQFTMIFDNEVLEFLDIKSSTYSASENIGLTMIDKGIITTSWNNSANIPLEKNVNATLFKLKFKAKANGTLSEILDINSSFTQAEAYSLNEELMNVELHFNNEQGAVVASEHFVLYQNIPNPVRNETVIGFKLPTATTATLKIFDASGKVLKVFKREGVKGYNSISIKQSELNKTGVLFYQLETSTDTQTRKMTVIK
jgi:hypothetical protein